MASDDPSLTSLAASLAPESALQRILDALYHRRAYPRLVAQQTRYASDDAAIVQDALAHLAYLTAWHEAALPIIQRVAEMQRTHDAGMTWCPMGCAMTVSSGDDDEHADNCAITQAKRLLADSEQQS